MALSGVVGTVGGGAADLLLRGDLAEQIGQDWRIASVACCDLDGPNFQRLPIYPEVDLAPDLPFRAAMLAGMPLAFALDHDTCVVYLQMQRTLGATVVRGLVDRRCGTAYAAQLLRGTQRMNPIPIYVTQPYFRLPVGIGTS